MANWTLPTTFATLSGNQPASLLDNNFSALATQPVFIANMVGTNTLTGTTSPLTFAAYSQGMEFIWVQPNTNTGATTLQINSVSPVQAVTKSGSTPLIAGDLVAGTLYHATYDGTQFQLSSSAGSGGGATGGGIDSVFYLNSLIVTTSYSIPSGKSAMCTGPITVNASVTVTVPSGSKWVVL